LTEQWPFEAPPHATGGVNVVYIGADRALWIFDDPTCKVVKYDLEGYPLYARGALGDWPGGFWNMHGVSVDQEGNLYVADVSNGRVPKFRPRPGANPVYLVGKPVYSAWK